ncbi:dual specificity mitogen-activated protein kinase kinase 5-like [Mercenaria mercenaria]|uniref:dual specificity mitogen-activated protein kinase kinase 5-like n=1 Tax=Mercenaria mercenaria TaxID=6596 RepID=UPI00234F4A81|nr:dual specificity mitogen-activated protein kinase kinase 5-like [Mercenaria mercenaria]
MNQSPQFTLRIRTEQDQDIDWMVHPEEITFHQAMEVISKILPGTTTTAFQYIDEDGEKITVRSDEELKAMFQMYMCELTEEDIQRGLMEPLVIYPRVGKTPKDRNRFDLRIKTQKGSKTPRTNVQQFQAKSLQKETTGDQPMEHSEEPMELSARGFSQMAGSPPNLNTSSHPHTLHPGQQLSGSPHMQNISPSQQRTSPGSIQMHQVSPGHYGAGNQSRAENIKEILTCGRMTADDLQQIALIGSGNGGHVYKAFHIPTQRLMAVKIIQLDVDIEVQKKILLELEILYKCHSPSIIGFYGAFFIENRISICTEFMDGGSLDNYGQIPEPILGRMAVNMVQGLIYMWSLKILHRDIKPSNILVNTDGYVKLCDFGVSTQLVESITKSHVGTNAYMAPERIKAEHYGAPSEVWSLGVTLYELAAGEFPFDKMLEEGNVNVLRLCNTILEEKSPTLPEEKFSAALCDFVARCLHKDPQKRITHPELLAHPYIQNFIEDDTSRSVLSAWIKSQLPLIQAGKIKKKKS